MLLVTFFYYENEKGLYSDLTKSNMQNITSDLSAKIILAHMTDTPFDKSNLLNNEDYKLSFYNYEKEKVFGNLDIKIDFDKHIIKRNEHFILVDFSTLGHLGIYHIVIQEHLFFKQMKTLKINIILFFLTIYSIIALIGVYLAKLFIKPIKEERLKLNNFIKDTTHELNTPISAILMSTESDTLNEKQIQRVRLSARRISEIYKDLTYVFLEENTNNKEILSISLDTLIKEQLNYFEPLLIKKRIKVVLDINKFDYAISKDDFIRLFNNIISNAIKYNNMGGDINISLSNDGKLSIKDTGIGIEKNKLNDIFNRYFRATKEQGGFGIGLNIVRHICTQYDIKIEVESVYKKGTCFSFWF